MAKGYDGLTDKQCAELLQHLISTLSKNGLSHLTISIEENLAFIAPGSFDRERVVDETNSFPVTNYGRLLHYLDATIGYLQQTSSHHFDSIRKRINQHLTAGELMDIVVEYSNPVDGIPNQVSVSTFPNYLDLIVELGQIREQIVTYRGNGQQE